MLNLREALAPLDGKTLRFQELRSELRSVRARHLRDFPMDFTTDDVMAVMYRNNWLIPVETDQFRIDLTSTVSHVA